MASKLGVAMVVNNLDVGGLEKVVVSLLNNLDRNRFDRYLICLDGPGKMADDVDLPPDCRLVLKKNPDRRLPLVGVNIDTSLFTAIRRFVRDKGIRVLHAHNLAPLLYAGIATRLIPMRNRPALVYSEHNQIYSASAGQKRRLKYYLKLADQVVSVSQDLQRTLVRDAGARPDGVRVLYNGIDGKRFVFQDKHKVRRELGIPDGDFVVGTAVVLSEQKGIAFLLDAARQVLAREPAIRFLIAGDGPLRADLEAKARQMELGDRVVFLGYRRDVPDLISSYDAYVLPSLWEGLPLALIEALAIGKPVVCTSVGGNPEIVEDAVNGFVVPPRDSAALADRILRLYKDRPFVDSVRQRNVEKFKQQFSLQSMVGAHERLFEELA
jgi:glycosyltransferase involved in cell wall biosynthesis